MKAEVENRGPEAGQGVNPMAMPIGFAASDSPILQSAYRAYSAERGALEVLIRDKLELAQLYDVPGMDRAVAVCAWGRSGSFLLQSYLDGHDDVVSLPLFGSTHIYQAYTEFGALSIWEKLIAYPTYSQLKVDRADGFLEGGFAIAAADYYAAVHALYASYGSRPTEWLDVRRRFFQFVHAAYALASGQRPANSQPLMVYAQHALSDELAARFVEDFPEARFVLTIRDPISSLDSWFEMRVDIQNWAMSHRSEVAAPYFDAAVTAVSDLLTWDLAHQNVVARTRAVRFEDLHLAPELTMRRLADWLGIAYRPCLLESTFNGVPYAFQARGGGATWVGANPSNAVRRTKNLNRLDRVLMYALLQEQFRTWEYRNRLGDRRRSVRLGIVALLCVVPMRIEWLNARLALTRQAHPPTRNGSLRFAGGALLFLAKRRTRMMIFMASQLKLRLLKDHPVVKLL